ncbi:MAG: DUF3604 domain-containing protein [Silicimonas sp.]|nr:DUF3604 domain-containing protein [Silicimonas sp.]
MRIRTAVFLSFLFAFSLSWAQDSNPPGMVPTPEDADNVVRKPSYSPYAGRNFPTSVYWGDTHVHTDNSLDAKGFGANLDVEDAYRFARGEEVTSNTGIPFKLSRPLDWLVVADHSDGMGAMKEIIKGNPRLISDPEVRGWYEAMNAGGDDAFKATMEVINSFSQGNVPAVVLDQSFQRTVWEDYIETAEAFNEPGRFTAIIGYEWTSTEGGLNLHRNVLYRDDGDVAKRIVPYTTAESFNPEDLWKWMANFEEKTGGSVLTLAHNGNMSNGVMFPVEVNPATGKRLGADYMRARIRWEPLYEITQIKGDGEAHPLLSPDDEFADFETLALGNLNLTAVKEDDMLQYEYAREALKNGLAMEQKHGTNPYKFGVVGSTDTHTGLAAIEEENYIGKHAGTEPSPERWEHPMAKFAGRQYDGFAMSAAGYAAVWATENTREALWDAMMRKEVYATTGPRMIVRFFGGWNFVEADANSRLPAEAGYSKGVPMGGDLRSAPEGKAPTFLVAALKDALSGNLDRIQIVKGWVDKRGNTYEKVYDVAWADADRRRPDANGKVPPVGNTVDVENATWTNTIGDPELVTVWTDPEFDPALRAFYYARVMEIPTPRWTAYDAKRYNLDMTDNVVMYLQERAYTSPIWYTP